MQAYEPRLRPNGAAMLESQPTRRRGRAGDRQERSESWPRATDRLDDGTAGSARTRSPASSATTARSSSASRASSTSTTRTTVREALLACCDEEPERLIVDLSEVKFIDSTALGVLIEARTRMPNRRGFLLAAPGLETRRALEISGPRPALHRARLARQRPRSVRLATHSALDAVRCRRGRGRNDSRAGRAAALRGRDRQGVARRRAGRLPVRAGPPGAPRDRRRDRRRRLPRRRDDGRRHVLRPARRARALRARLEGVARRRQPVGDAPDARAREARGRARRHHGRGRPRVSRRRRPEAHRRGDRRRRRADEVLPPRESRPQRALDRRRVADRLLGVAGATRSSRRSPASGSSRRTSSGSAA